MRRAAIALFSCVLMTGALACTESDGPAERAGEKIDETAESVGEAVEDAGDRMQGQG